MLNWMTRKFKSIATQPRADTLDSDANILWLLNGLCEQQTPLEIKLQHSFSPYQSRILAVNQEQNSLLLAELSPVDGHAHIVPGKEISIEVDNQQGHIWINAAVEAVQHQASGYSYRLSLPATISFRAHATIDNEETRQHPRVQPSDTYPVGLERFFDGARNIEATIENISLSGLGLSLTDAPNLKSGDRIESVAVTLPDGKLIEADLEVRHVEQQRDGVTLGAEFVDLNDTQASTLASVVAQLAEKE